MIQSDRSPTINPGDGKKIAASEVISRAEAAARHACDYFGTSSDWRIDILAEPPSTSTAEIEHDGVYLRATIRLDVQHYQERPERIWRDIGHEIAHLVTTEMPQLWHRLPEEVRDGPLKNYYREAVERATVRLERMFVRDVPESHDPYGRPRRAPTVSLKGAGPPVARLGDGMTVESGHQDGEPQTCASCCHWLSNVDVPGVPRLGRCLGLSNGGHERLIPRIAGTVEQGVTTNSDFGCNRWQPMRTP